MLLLGDDIQYQLSLSYKPYYAGDNDVTLLSRSAEGDHNMMMMMMIIMLDDDSLMMMMQT